MADPAEAGGRDVGNPNDEEERPDLGYIDGLLSAAAGATGQLDLRYVSTVDGDRVVLDSGTGLEVFWMAPDMEGHPDADARGRLAAAAPELLRSCVAEIRRLIAMAGITG